MKKHFFWIYLITFCLLSTYNLFAAPAITGINPFVGPSAGGTSVDIEGSGFTGTTAVHFGNIPATSFVINSDNSITVTAPPHSPQVVFITVTAAGISPLVTDAYFTYQGNWQAYVVNRNSSNVSVINTANQDVMTTPIENFPSAVAITPDSTQVYIANSVSDLSVIDTANQMVTTTPVGSIPAAIAITPNSTQAYVANNTSANVSVIDTANQSTITTVGVGDIPDTVAITPDGTQAYVANFSDGTVSIIDTANPSIIITTVGVGNNPCASAITPNGMQAYVVNRGSANVSVIDTANPSTITTVGVGSNPYAIAITPNGMQAYVVNRGSANVTVIDTANQSVEATIGVGTNPIAIAITPNGMQAYVINQGSANVTVIDTATQFVGATIGVGTNPIAIAITPDGMQAYVANESSDSVSVIDTASQSVKATIGVGTRPIAIAITPDQAPLARFTYQLATAGSPSQFDASNSVSPVGNITNYVWDFGDGNTGNTPIISHTYTSSGNYAVKLTVTNSAGTANMQIFNPNSNSDVGAGRFYNTSQAVTHNGDSRAVLIQQITILPALIITGLSPISGSTCGGTTVTITGENLSSVTGVLFGSNPATSFTINSDISITAIAPPGTPGSVNVVLTTSSGQSAITPADQFTYLPISVTSISPTSGSIGTSVTLNGTNFTCAMGVFFGSIPATSFTINSDTSMTAIAPPGATGTINITVTTALDQSAITPADQFTYLSNGINITSLNPTFSFTCGGTSVTIVGSNFTGATGVFFGSIPATSFTINSDTSITAIAPPEAPGTVDVTITSPFGQSAITTADQFTYSFPLPPKNLKGYQTENEFATQTDMINVLNWRNPSKNCQPVAYRIYRDRALTKLVAEVSGHAKLEFIDHDRKKGKTYRYFIVSVDPAGYVSAPAKVVIKG